MAGRKAVREPAGDETFAAWWSRHVSGAFRVYIYIAPLLGADRSMLL